MYVSRRLNRFERGAAACRNHCIDEKANVTNSTNHHRLKNTSQTLMTT